MQCYLPPETHCGHDAQKPGDGKGRTVTRSINVGQTLLMWDRRFRLSILKSFLKSFLESFLQA